MIRIKPYIHCAFALLKPPFFYESTKPFINLGTYFAIAIPGIDPIKKQRDEKAYFNFGSDVTGSCRYYNHGAGKER
jgi:hypothetical protein